MLSPENHCRIQPTKPQQCRDFPNWTTPQLEIACPALAMNKPHIYKPIKLHRVWGTETILLSALPNHPTCEYETGVTLPDLLAAQPQLLGDIPTFPLLFKRLTTTDCLSVQVHPSVTSAPQTGGDPKTEMWFILRDTKPHAHLYAGLTTAATPDHLASPKAEHCLLMHQPNHRDTILVPGGLVHAIGPGCDIYEVQQTSNTTFRLYDWNRTDAEGVTRPLHIKEALASIDWDQPAPTCAPNDKVTSPFFTTNIRTLPVDLPVSNTFKVLYTEDEEVTLLWGGSHETLLPAHHCCLIPAQMALRVKGCGSLLVTTP